MPKYHNLHLAFSKEHVFSLTPHRTYDCTTELLPGALLPITQLHSLSRTKPMESYIKDYIKVSLDHRVLL